MNRVQFIELHEQPWLPAFVRNDITDTLQYGLNRSGAYACILPLLQSALEATRAMSAIDLCSGGGGPWLVFAGRLKRDTRDIRIILTDKYPTSRLFGDRKRCSEMGIDYYKGSVDARQVPAWLDGFRTMFTSFHHFSPADAQAIIQSAVCAGKGIGIFEITRRSLWGIITVVLWSMASLLFIPFVRPFRWSRLFFSYVLPIIPFVLLFDGIVSCLRSYGANELASMAAKLAAAGYRWQAGELAGSSGRIPVIYLIGYPEKDCFGFSNPTGLSTESASHQLPLASC